jgi:hypothetical protein
MNQQSERKENETTKTDESKRGEDRFDPQLPSALNGFA